MVERKNYSIYLRAFEHDDYILINKWRNDSELQKLTTGQIRYVSSEMEKAWVQQKMMSNTNEIYWAICANDGTDKMIGYTSINNINYINKSFLGGGVVIGDSDYRDGQAAVESFYMRLDYAFNELNMHRYYSWYLPNHIFSKSLQESMFCSVEGIEREAVFKMGKYYDLVHSSLLRREFLEHQNNGDYAIPLTLRRLVKAIKLNRAAIKE